MNFMEILRTAAFALRGNWMRSALTSLGVIIGIAAVIVMVSVGQGTQAEIDKLVSGLGSNRLDISSGSSVGGGGVRLAAGSRYTLSVDDADAIRKEIPEVQYVAASLRGGSQVVSGENNWSTQWQGVQPDWFDINDWIIASGQAFESRDYGGASKSIILGDTVRQQLFGDQDALGQTVRLGRVPFTVIATLKPKGQGGFGQDQDDLVVVPLETARRRLSGATALPPGAVQQISLGVGRAEDLSYAQGEVEALLRQRHRIQPGDDDDFNVRNISEIVATRTQTTRLMSLLLGAVAGISLVVGGIGIMNIMLVSVTERIPRNWPTHGGRRGPRRYPQTVPGRGDADLADRRGDRNPAGHRRRPAGGQVRIVAGCTQWPGRGAGGGVFHRDRAVLRLLPGAQGIDAGSDRSLAPTVSDGAIASALSRARVRVRTALANGPSVGGLLPVPFFHALLQLIRRDILDVGAQGPFVPEGVDDGAGAVAPELVLDRPKRLCSSLDRLVERTIDVVHVDHERRRRAAERFGAAR